MCGVEECACLQELHANLQPLLHLFIDGASSIEQDDPNWELFLALQGVQGSVKVVSRGIQSCLYADQGSERCVVAACSLACASCACRLMCSCITFSTLHSALRCISFT